MAKSRKRKSNSDKLSYQGLPVTEAQTVPLYHATLGERHFTPEHAKRLLDMQDDNGGWSEEPITEEPITEEADEEASAKTDDDAASEGASTADLKGRATGAA